MQAMMQQGQPPDASAGPDHACVTPQLVQIMPVQLDRKQRSSPTATCVLTRSTPTLGIIAIGGYIYAITQQGSLQSREAVTLAETSQGRGLYNAGGGIRGCVARWVPRSSSSFRQACTS